MRASIAAAVPGVLRGAMCTFLEAFVPSSRVLLPPPLRGLSLAFAMNVHPDFARRHASTRGTMLSFRSSQGCLCGFDDFAAAYALARAVLEQSGAPWIEVWACAASDEYAPRVREARDVAPLEHGEIVVLRRDAA